MGLVNISAARGQSMVPRRKKKPTVVHPYQKRKTRDSVSINSLPCGKLSFQHNWDDFYTFLGYGMLGNLQVLPLAKKKSFVVHPNASRFPLRIFKTLRPDFIAFRTSQMQQVSLTHTHTAPFP